MGFSSLPPIGGPLSGKVQSILVKGFKSFKREQAIELKPFTVLAGANSAGKSSFFQLLLLLKQTLESDSDPGALLLNGDSVKFTELSQLFWRPAGGTPAQTMSIGFTSQDGRTTRQFYKRSPFTGLELSHLAIKVDSRSQTYNVGTSYTLGQFPGVLVDEMTKLGPFGPLFKHYIPDGKGWRDWRVRLARQGGLLVFELLAPPSLFGGEERDIWLPVYSPLAPLAALATDLVHLSGLRGNPERDYPKRAVGSRFPGAFQDYVASIVASWTDEDGRLRLEKLNGWVKRLGLGQAIQSQRTNDVAYQVVMERKASRNRGSNCSADTVNIADVGLGVSQVLPVLVALLTRGAKNRSGTVYVEQPEIHLHPRSQKEMARLMAEEAASGASIVVETHSSLFLLGLQTAIAEGIIKSDDVALYWFNQDELGATTVTTAELDDRGRFGDWPEDFDEVSLLAEKEYMMAQMKLRGRGDHEA